MTRVNSTTLMFHCLQFDWEDLLGNFLLAHLIAVCLSTLTKSKATRMPRQTTLATDMCTFSLLYSKKKSFSKNGKMKFDLMQLTCLCSDQYGKQKESKACCWYYTNEQVVVKTVLIWHKVHEQINGQHHRYGHKQYDQDNEYHAPKYFAALTIQPIRQQQKPLAITVLISLV